MHPPKGGIPILDFDFPIANLLHACHAGSWSVYTSIHVRVRRKTADTTSVLGKKSHGGPRRATLPTRLIPDPLFRRVDPEMGHTGILTDHA